MRLMTSEEVARLLSVTEKTLANWRSRRVIPYVKVNGVVRYEEERIKAWIQEGVLGQRYVLGRKTC